MSLPPNRREPSNTSIVILLVMAAFAVRIGYCAWRGDLGVTPPELYREYVIAGSALVRHGLYICPLIGSEVLLHPSTWLPPAYVGIVSAVYSLIGIETRAATLVLQSLNALATSIAVGLIFITTHRLWNRRAAWIAAIIAIFHPLLFGYTQLIWETSLYTLEVAVLVWWSVRLSVRDVRAQPSFLFGMGMGVAALLNPSFTICYPILVLRPIVHRHKWSGTRIFVGTSAAIAGWAVAISPWVVRDYQKMARLVYIRDNFWAEVWMGVCPEADNLAGSVFDTRFALRTPDEQSRLIALGESAYLDECRAKAKTAIASNPARFIRLVGCRTADFWLGTVISHGRSAADWYPRSAWRAIIMFCLWMELALLGIALWLCFRRRVPVLWLLGSIFLFSLTYGLTHFELRFRAPVEVMSVIVVGIVIDALWRARRSPPADARGTD